jgi:hypothetical protein
MKFLSVIYSFQLIKKQQQLLLQGSFDLARDGSTSLPALHKYAGSHFSQTIALHYRAALLAFRLSSAGSAVVSASSPFSNIPELPNFKRRWAGELSPPARKKRHMVSELGRNIHACRNRESKQLFKQNSDFGSLKVAAD